MTRVGAARALVAAAAIAVASHATATPTKLACFTERVHVQEGAPVVILANFDEDRKTAGMFVKDFGGIVNGQHVDIGPDTVMFDFTTSTGTAGKALIMRSTGSMMLTLGERKMLANCRKDTNRF